MQSSQFQLHASMEDKHWWFVGRRRILHSLVEYILPPSRTRLLVDIGCGTGANIASFSQQYQCVGIDTSEEAIHHARKRFPEVSFINGIAPEDLGQLAETADAFMLTDVLEHVEDDREMFAHLLGSMRTGTHIVITVPADPSLWTKHDVSFGHYRRYTKEKLTEVWSKQPVRVKLLSAFNTRLCPIVKTIRVIRKITNTSGRNAGTDITLPPGPINTLLTNVFSGERSRLLGILKQQTNTPYKRGVSLVAVLEKLRENAL